MRPLGSVRSIKQDDRILRRRARLVRSDLRHALAMLLPPAWERLPDLPDAVRDKFLSLAGDKEARIVVIPTASERADSEDAAAREHHDQQRDDREAGGLEQRAKGDAHGRKIYGVYLAPTLFRSQRDQRIHLRRAARRDEAGDEGHRP